MNEIGAVAAAIIFIAIVMIVIKKGARNDGKE